MGLSYHFTFSAPATVTADILLKFLRKVENDAKQMGFRPTTVLEAEFDTSERREFARRLWVRRSGLSPTKRKCRLGEAGLLQGSQHAWLHASCGFESGHLNLDN